MKLKKPQQLCALKRLQKHQVGDSKGNLSCPLKPITPEERIALGMQDEANDQSAVENPLQRTLPGEGTSVQPPCLEKTEQVVLHLLHLSPVKG